MLKKDVSQKKYRELFAFMNPEENFKVSRELNIKFIIESSHHHNTSDENAIWISLHKKDFGPIATKNVKDRQKVEANAKLQYIFSYLFRRAINQPRRDVAQMELHALYLSLRAFLDKDAPWTKYFLSKFSFNGLLSSFDDYGKTALNVYAEAFHEGHHLAGLELLDLFSISVFRDDVKEKTSAGDIISNALYAVSCQNYAAVISLASIYRSLPELFTNGTGLNAEAQIQQWLMLAITANVPDATRELILFNKCDFYHAFSAYEHTGKIDCFRVAMKKLTELKLLLPNNTLYQAELDKEYAHMSKVFNNPDAKFPAPVTFAEKWEKTNSNLEKQALINELRKSLLMRNDFDACKIIARYYQDNPSTCNMPTEMFWFAMLAISGITELVSELSSRTELSPYEHLALTIFYTFGARGHSKFGFNSELARTHFKAAVVVNSSAVDEFLAAGRVVGLLTHQVEKSLNEYKNNECGISMGSAKLNIP